MATKSEVSVTLSDLQVLDCKVCNQPLTIPVFQCKAGHTACESCCERLENICSTCGLAIDSECCHLEEIIQSHKLPCPNKDYGCEELISYCNTKDHAKHCFYECYPCPEPGCQFRGLSSQLSDHFLSTHTLSNFESFRYGQSFYLELKNEKICLLKEKASGNVFVLSNETSTCGGRNICLSVVDPMGRLSRQVAEVRVTVGFSVFTFRGVAPIARSISDKSQHQTQVHISSVFLGLEDSFSVSLKVSHFDWNEYFNHFAGDRWKPRD